MKIGTEVSTPAFVIDEAYLDSDLQECLSLSRAAGCRMLYSPKALAIPHVLQRLAHGVDGFSCSSLNEVRLAGKAIREHGTIHLVTPGIIETQMETIAELCDFTVLNSLSHWNLYSQALAGEVSLGLRVNPGISFVNDDRYDPCRLHSKLGVSLDRVAEFYEAFPHKTRDLEGLHFHNNCDSKTAGDLVATIERVTGRLSDLFRRIRWVNLGGGYLLSELHDPELFSEAIHRLKRQFDIDVFVEPGAALVRSAGSIISRVIDLFENDGLMVAVLDTTVNHMPEVLEYEFTPTVVGACEGGRYSYVLAGCTCLAGDQFGVVNFEQPLAIGSVVIFPDCGAYTFSRANTFNGVSLPTIYRRTVEGELMLVQSFDFKDFALRAGEPADVGI